jgi:hypothetical protein
MSHKLIIYLLKQYKEAIGFFIDLIGKFTSVDPVRHTDLNVKANAKGGWGGSIAGISK